MTHSQQEYAFNGQLRVFSTSMTYRRYDEPHAKSSNPTAQRVPALNQIIGQLKNTVENSDLSVEEIETAVKEEIERYKTDIIPEGETVREWQDPETGALKKAIEPKNKDSDLMTLDYSIVKEWRKARTLRTGERKIIENSG